MVAIERVSGRDAAFFLLEGPNTPYHVAALITLEGPSLPHQDLLRAVERRLDALPRFRQRLDHPAFTGRPAWVDDPAFDLEYHVRRTSVQAPGTEEQLKHLVAELMEEHVSRFRPLWELWAIDGLLSGGTALLLKVHHAMADGVTGVRDLMLLFDEQRRTAAKTPRKPRPAEPPRHEPPPGRARLLAGAAIDALAFPGDLWRAGVRSASHPEAVAATALGCAEVAAAAIRPAPRSPFNVAIGPNRTFDLVRVPMADVKEIGTAWGATVNDVVLAATAGGMRRWMVDRGHAVDGLELRALIPVSLRTPGDADSAGNRVSGVIGPLPVFEPDPVARLMRVHEGMLTAKRSKQVLGAGAMLNLPALVPGPLARPLAGLQRVQRFFNICITNVPGPKRPLYLAGRRIADLIPVTPLSANCALLVAAISYAGELTFGLVADPDAVPDLGVIAEGIDKSLMELLHALPGGGAR